MVVYEWTSPLVKLVVFAIISSVHLLPHKFATIITMKFSLFAIPALSLLASAAPTASNNAVEQRAAASPLEQWITGLTTEVKGYTAHLSPSQHVPNIMVLQV